MSEEVESAEDIRKGVVKELKQLACAALDRVKELVEEEAWDQATGALGTIEYVLRAANEWK